MKYSGLVAPRSWLVCAEERDEHEAGGVDAGAGDRVVADGRRAADAPREIKARAVGSELRIGDVGAAVNRRDEGAVG